MITYRLIKGEKLTKEEGDENFRDLARYQAQHVHVTELGDLPEAVSGAIQLEDFTTYEFHGDENGDFDLEGSRLVCGENNVIMSVSSEVCRLTSTGLANNTALITTTQTLEMWKIQVQNVHTALDINGGVNRASLALDWTGVNFVNVPNVGTIQNFANFIFNKGVFSNCAGLVFGGEFDTVAIDDSFLSGNGTGGNHTTIADNTVINRRFRVTQSAVVSVPGDTYLSYGSNVTIPAETLIYDKVNFAGGGTYFNGVTSSDVQSFWKGCSGITNSSEIAYYTMIDNSTATVISSQDTPVKIAGTTTQSAITQKFNCTNNRATYTGGISRPFKVTAIVSVESGNNNQVGVYVAKNGTVIDESETYSTTSGNNRVEAIKCQCIVNLAQGDYIEMWTENGSSTANITAFLLSVIIEPTS